MPRLRKTALSTEPEWPSNVLTQLKSDRAHRRTVLSLDAVATHCSSHVYIYNSTCTHAVKGLHAQSYTVATNSAILTVN